MNEDPSPTSVRTRRSTVRSTIDLQPLDRQTLDEMSAAFETTSDAEALRTCLRIAHWQVRFVREAPGNEIVLEKADRTKNALSLFKTMVLPEDEAGSDRGQLTRKTVDLDRSDRLRLDYLAQAFRGLPNSEVFRICLRIVRPQVAFIREQKGNHVYNQRSDGSRQALLYFEIMALDKERETQGTDAVS